MQQYNKTMQKMINFDNSNKSQIPDYRHRILIIGGSGSGKTSLSMFMSAIPKRLYTSTIGFSAVLKYIKAVFLNLETDGRFLILACNLIHSLIQKGKKCCFKDRNCQGKKKLQEENVASKTSQLSQLFLSATIKFFTFRYFSFPQLLNFISIGNIFFP